MKRILCLLAACAIQGCSAWAADATITFTTTDSPRIASTGYIDWAQVSTKQGSRLINVFGYNSGGQQWIQLYNSSNGVVLPITDSFDSENTFVTSGYVYIGEPVQFTNTIAGVTAGIYFARPVTNSVVKFQVYDTRAHALNAAATTGIKDVTSDLASGNIQLLPRHTFAVASTDNYSFIVPGTGMGFGQGVVIAASATGPTFTPSGTNVTICATYLP
jgi:hypothetical protein